MADNGPRIVEVDQRSDGQRLDNFLLRELKALHQSTPKSLIYRIIRKGEVRVNKKRAKPHTRLHLQDQIRIPPVRIAVETSKALHVPEGYRQRIERAILFEDEVLLVVNKPAGLAVHAGSQTRFGLIDLIQARDHSSQAELVHRLDRQTSGLMVVAKNRKALTVLSEQVRPGGAAKKRYRALVHGHWPNRLVHLHDCLLKRKLGEDSHRVVVDPKEGKPAHTEVLTRQTGVISQQPVSLLSLVLHTGRTHQIRVHCQFWGHALVGDDKYGNRALDHQLIRPRPGLMLHAEQLTIEHPVSKVALHFAAPLPEKMKSLIKQAGIKAS